MLLFYRPVPTYTWKKIDIDGKEKPIENNKDGIIFTDQINRVLVIQSANKFHAGRYICTATIGDKSDTVEGYLRYKGATVLILLKAFMKKIFRYIG